MSLTHLHSNLLGIGPLELSSFPHHIMSSESDPKAQSHSTLKDFIASIASIRGDLSNITAPPFVLDTKSVVELPAFWAERPSFFVAPASSSDPAERALLVLRWFLASLKNQQYGGRAEDEGVKKPLNAFLGECFLAKWDDDDKGETMLVSEQVSHHPPVTACRLWNEKNGVYAEGFTRQIITLTLGNIAIKQIGHALLTLKNHDDETYLIPLADVKVKGILSGLSGSYPELDGTYTIPCTSGYYSVIDFSGKSLLGGGRKNEFEAKVYASSDKGADADRPIYTVTGHWNESITIYKGDETSKETEREHIVLKDVPTVPLKLFEPKLEAQDPWESRRAWRGVSEALTKGDMMAAAKAKSVVEQGQRAMRKDEEHEGKTWKPLFFKAQDDDPVAAHLYKSILKDLKPDPTVAIWKFDEDLWQQGIKKPFHGNLTPDNKGVHENGGMNGNVVIVGRQFNVDREDVSSPASFRTAQEYPFPDAPQRKAPEQPPPKPAAAETTTKSTAVTKPPAAEATTERTAATKPMDPVTPPRRRSTTPHATPQTPTTGDVTPSSASISPSTRRGKRQRARDSIGKFRLSLTNGLQKIPGVGQSPPRSDAGNRSQSPAAQVA